MFILPDTETDTGTDKKMDGRELCGSVLTAQRQTSTQIPIGFSVNLPVSVSVSVSVSDSVSWPIHTPQDRDWDMCGEGDWHNRKQ